MRRQLPYLLPLAGIVALVLMPLRADAQYRYPPSDPGYGPPQARYFADVRIQITPKQAAVYIDGYHAGLVDDFDGAFQRLHLEAGQHEIAFYLEGYRTLRQLVYVSPNQARTLSGTLERLAPGEPDPGPPQPISPPEPPESRRPPSNPEPDAPPPPRQPPASVSDAPPGPRPATRYATLSIQVDPANAELAIDGGERRKISSSNERLLIQVANGRHRIEVTRGGYVPYSTDVEVESGETLDLDISLVREK